MKDRPLTDPRRRNALILALKRAMEATLDESDWKELGYLTNTIEWISDHPRLLRSLRWGDPDYAGHVLDAIERMLDEDPANLQVLLSFGRLEEWIRNNEPEVYTEFYEGALPAVETVEDAKEAARGFDIDDHIRRIRG